MSSSSEILEKLDLLTTLIGWDPVKKNVLLRLSQFVLSNAFFKVFGDTYRQTKGMPMGGMASRCE